MNNDRANSKYYAAGIAIAVAFAGTLAVKVAVNLHDVMKDAPSASSSPSTPKVPRVTAERPVADNLPSLINQHLQNEAFPQRSSLAQLYEDSHFAPLWVRSPDHLKDLKQAAEDAAAQGIDSGVLVDLLEGTDKKSLANQSGESIAMKDIALGKEALVLAQALRLGVLQTKQMGDSWHMTVDTFDPLPDLAAALKGNKVKAYFTDLQPPEEQYRTLIKALAAYQDLAAKGGWPTLDSATEIKLGKPDERNAALRQRLVAEGYLKNPDADDATLMDAVKAFQTRNGLEPDGRLGKDTVAAMNVSADERVGQIAANLERWRHTPRDRGDKYIAVNTAATTLAVMNKGEPGLKLNVITGDRHHGTPILNVRITGVTLNPRWEIPYSIATKEILPKLQKNPNYLVDNNMVIVDGPAAGTQGEGIDWAQYSRKGFPMRFRQKAGDDNSLGLVKFQMQNEWNIYLHDTPGRKAFAKFERHLSHGCVRVDQPATLAENVLTGTGEWTEESIKAQIDKGRTETIALKTPLPVYIFYWTAFGENGTVAFRNDIYKRDHEIAEALGIGAGTENKMAEEKATPAPTPLKQTAQN